MSNRDSLLFFRFKAPLPLVVGGGITKWEIRNEVREKEVSTVAACLDTKQIIPLVPGRSRIVDGRTEGMEFLARHGTTIYRIALKLIREAKAEEVR